MTDFKMPQLGETVLEATITKWLKQEGDPVQEDEPLVEVSTDKVDSEIPSPVSGTVSRILAGEGDTVEVGAVLAQIDASGEAPAPARAAGAEPAAKPPTAPPAPPPAAPAPRPQPVAEEPPRPPVAAPEPARDSEESGRAAAAVASGDDSFRGVLSPLVRRLAAERDIDLRSVVGTGAGGRITKQDVLRQVQGDGAAAASRGATAPAATAAAPKLQEVPRPAPEPVTGRIEPAAHGAEEVVQVSPMRRAIADHMITSMTSTARAWNTIEVDMSKVGRLRAVAGAPFKKHEGFSLTWMPFVCKALTQALLRFPQLNSTWNGDGTITRKHYVNLGIAVALENGLIVPVIKGAEGMSLVGLARAVRDIADRARGKKLSPDDVQGGTFTITNPGGFGSIMSVPIINRGQAAILAFDAVVKRPVVVTGANGDDSIAIRPMTFLSMSWDHRIIDGAEAAQFLAYLKSLLEAADYESDLGGLLPS